MIAIKGRARMIGSGSFQDAVHYAVREGRHAEHEPVLAAWSQGVTSLDAAAQEMESVAARSRAKTDAVYHLVVS
ncbi:MAG: hypothetical protein M3Y18_09575, partial [Candidatus Eremiobacteraeota bacterium]|nr:hypothetical protein [Candidatus Eremiobacteraeota bacterium]